MRSKMIFVCVLLLWVPLTAQQRTGNIFGTIMDQEGNPLPGALVTLTGEITAPVSTITSAEGKFRFLSLSPAKNYVLKAELEGFKTLIRENIIVAVGTNTELTLVMEMGSLEEEITVTASSPVVDAKKTSVSHHVTEEMLQSLPTARDPWVVLQMTPGVMVDRENVGGSESGQQSTFVGMGSSNYFNNVWAIDGIVITDPAAIGASPTYYDFDAFEAMNITVGGADVAVQTGGIALNMVTRRGGNRVSLGGRFYLTDEKFQADNLTEDLIKEGVKGTNRIISNKDYGFNVGFPILKDKAWFWGSYGVQDLKTKVITGARDDTLLENYAAKLNLQIVPQNRFEAFVHAGKKEKWGRFASYATPEGYHQTGKYHFGSPILKLQDEHMFGDNLLLSLKFAFSDAGFGFVPMIDENDRELVTFNVEKGQFERHYGNYLVSRPVYQYDLMMNYFHEDLLGAAHDIKFGLGYADRNADTKALNPGNTQLNYNYHTKTVDVTGDGIPDVARDYGVDIAQFQVFRGFYRNYGVKAFSAYFSDTISIGRFNLMLGLRYDNQRPLVNPTTIFTALPDHYMWQTYTVSGTAEAINRIFPAIEIPEIKPDFAWEVWSPRLGLTWDILGNGKTIAKLSFAKYGDFMGVGQAGNFMPLGTGGQMNFWWVDDNGDGLIDFKELYWHRSGNYQLYRVFDNNGTFTGNWEDMNGIMWFGYDYKNPKQTKDPTITIDPEVNSTNTWETIATVEREVLPDFGVSADLIFRRYDGFNWAPLPYYPNTGHVRNPSDYVQVGTVPDQVGGFSTGEAAGKPYYLLKEEVGATNYSHVGKQKGAHNDYYGFNLRATKRLSNRWMMSGSLTLQTQKAHFGKEGFQDPLISVGSGNFRNPTNRWGFDGQVYAALIGGVSGKINQYVFSNWLFKLTGLYQFPYEINASFTFQARQGHIIPRMFTLVDYNAPNPLNRSVPILCEKFGKEHLPTMARLDVRVEKILRLGDTGSIAFMLDIFNVLNSAIINRRYARNLGTYYVHDGSFSPNPTNYLANEILNPRVLRFGVRFMF
ncbi:MAG: carboxypeptidase regulatory-like domain-containing protein [Candidatus Aminicenantales bacterium]